ncbi:AfsA-related hotdog domain-containing protein [Kutzneria sp. NPDC052558]|uniref:AfsA-related hotdog domain-containing protein n=1 Tax=Kutzneria sp. NPDC052558 TaxID=3364121 RepID=UPI0037C64F7B
MTTIATERLSTDRTIAKGLVHRVALEEVFLTDFRSVPDGGFLATARLPRSHAYYNDHTNHPATHDPLAVFECVRQMLLCALHLHHDAPATMKSITATCGLDIADPLALVVDGYDLDLFGTVVTHKERDGVTTRVVHSVDVRLGDRLIGTVTVDTAQKDPERYEALRMTYRDSRPPQSDALIDTEPVSRVAPYLVGRCDSDNVVLLAPRVEQSALVAGLRVPVSNPGMFDHAHDHVPGPVMMEAARQAGTLLAGELYGHASSKTVLTGLTATYARFAELDSPITVTAQAGAAMTDPITVRFAQGGEIAADMTITLGSTVSRRGE